MAKSQNSKEINWPTQDLTECAGELVDVFEDVENQPFPDERDFVSFMDKYNEDQDHDLPF